MRIKHLKYLLSVLSACYFLLAGTGYNIIEYCCDDCAHEGIEFVSQHSCATVHHEKHHDCDDVQGVHPLANDSHSHLQTCVHDNSCEVIRVQLDNFLVTDDVVNTTVSFNDVLVDFNANHKVAGQLAYAHVLHEYSPPPHLFVLCGREILTNKSVLVI